MNNLLIWKWVLQQRGFMITLADFQSYLSHKTPLKQPLSTYLEGQEQQLLKWAASLPAQTEDQQAVQLERVLTELTAINLDDKLRLKLLDIAICAADRLITSLHKYYRYELGALNKEQLSYIDQVKSLYYLTILAYDGVIQRESSTLQQHLMSGRDWRQLLTLAKKPPIILATAIYQSLAFYQKLLYEQDISYQPPPAYLWQAFNQLYHLACQFAIAHIDLSSHVVTKQAHSIHQLYVQICLHSLLNVRAMRRANILLIQRLLPLWSTHIHATTEPQTQTRIYVDLLSDNPPDYLTAKSTINPYEEHCLCLFIELEPLVACLHQRKQALFFSNNEAVEYQLVNSVLMAIGYRYIERQTTTSIKHSAKKRATVISGFNNMHYKVAGSRGLMSMIAAQTLPTEQLPHYDTSPKNGSKITVLNVEAFDTVTSVSPFGLLRLLTTEDLIRPQAAIEEKAKTPQAHIDKTLTFDSTNFDSTNTAPPPLPLMSLLLLCRQPDNGEPTWSIGIVRWVNFEDRYTEAEWQILGHKLTACALRLDSRDHRSQNFVPAFMIASDKELHTEFTLMVPPYHFQANDKVILRIDDKQKTLRLQDCLMSSAEFSQYKVLQI